MGKRILVVGSGGREHAIAWRLARDPEVDSVLVAPGNGGTAGGKLCSIGAGSAAELAALAAERDIRLTVVGPEAPLAAGIADEFARIGRRILGPSKAAARIEFSKIYAKGFMDRHGIPTPKWGAHGDEQSALKGLSAFDPPYVVKADGLAAGKGVVIAPDLPSAERASALMLRGMHGDASRKIVIEEYAAGREVSLIALCDGERYSLLATSMDSKRLSDGDSGPNTGGMGAFSPVQRLNAAQLAETAIAPVLAGMRAEGIEYRGFLYAGLVIGGDGAASVLEYNCRLGDPEAQVILPLWGGSAYEACAAAADGSLAGEPQPQLDGCAVGVVLASPGYPDSPQAGIQLEVPQTSFDADGCMAFHAATERSADGSLRTCGGRVLCATGLAETLAAARKQAYGLARSIGFPGAVMRSDIAARA